MTAIGLVAVGVASGSAILRSPTPPKPNPSDCDGSSAGSPLLGGPVSRFDDCTSREPAGSLRMEWGDERVSRSGPTGCCALRAWRGPE
jgi:hypothetical protein